MKVIIAGGRNYCPGSNSKQNLVKVLEQLKATEVVCGMACGADTFGKEVGESLGLKIAEFPADWYRHGRGAGFIRNEEMANYAEACILFPGGKGTADMKRRALRHQLIVIEMGQ